MTIIAIILAFTSTPDRDAFLKEENYAAMEQVVSTIIEEKNTEVKFDKSKINNYEVTYKADGSKEIYIQGKTLEEIYLMVDENYQIKELIKVENFNLIILYVAYIMIIECFAYIITESIFYINRTIKKIIIFFKKK